MISPKRTRPNTGSCCIVVGPRARSYWRLAKIAGYIGKSSAFATALAEFAESYGNQTELDHAALVEAIQTGRVQSLQE